MGTKHRKSKHHENRQRRACIPEAVARRIDQGVGARRLKSTGGSLDDCGMHCALTFIDENRKALANAGSSVLNETPAHQPPQHEAE